MKTINKFLLFITVAGITLLSSCNSDYLEKDPTDQMSTDIIGGTVDNLYTAINGIHRAMYRQYYKSQSKAGEAGMMISLDGMGEDVVWANRSNGWFIPEASWQAHRNVNSAFIEWGYHYYSRLILNANLILDKIEQAEEAKDSGIKKEYVKGEALAFRAYSHFKLVQLYAKRYETGGNNQQPGIPYRMEPAYTPIARISVEEVYTNILKDLDESINLLKGYRAYDVNHFTEKVVTGIKARVLLAQQRYQEAANTAMDAIQIAEQEKFKLQSEEELLSGFNSAEANSEWLWATIMPTDQTIYFHSFFAFMSWNFNSSNIRNGARLINNKLYETMSNTDIRREWWDPTGKKPGPNSRYKKFKYQTRKFTCADNTSSVGDVPYMRLAELYLMAAEAFARSGNEKEAKNIFTKFMKTRDSEYKESTATGEKLIEEIMNSRRVELWGEGFRFTDLKRLNMDLNREGANHDQSVIKIMFVPAGDKQWQFLIPKAEMESNKEMIQNEL